MSGLTFSDYGFQIHRKGGHVVNFQAARQDAEGTIKYFAWLSEDGSYVIMEHDRADLNDITIKYFHSKNSENSAVFQTDWNARTTLTYIEYNAIYP